MHRLTVTAKVDAQQGGIHPLLLVRLENALREVLGNHGRPVGAARHEGNYVYCRVEIHDCQPLEHIESFLTGIVCGILVDNFVEVR